MKPGLLWLMLAPGMALGVACVTSPLWLTKPKAPLLLVNPGDVQLDYDRDHLLLSVSGQLPHDGWTATVDRSEYDAERHLQRIYLRLYEDNPLRRLTEDGKPPLPHPFHLTVQTAVVEQIFISRVIE